ncbi:hypothetical protein SK128_023033, partial [Halocaridina rubra]
MDCINDDLRSKAKMPGNVQYASYSGNNNAPARAKSLDCLADKTPTDEYIPSRISRMTPRANDAAMQFVKTGPAKLYKTATEQIKKSEAVKAMRKHLIAEEEEWQQNLDKWKSSRRKRNEEALERVIEIKKNEQEEEFGRMRRKSKTFSEMCEEKNKRGRRYNLVVHDDDNNDLGDLGLSSAKSTSSLNDVHDDSDVKDIDQDNKDAKSDAGFCTGSDTGSDGVFAEDNISDTSSALGDKKETHDSLLDSGINKDDEPHINGHCSSITADILQANSSNINCDEYTYDKAIEGYKQYAENSAKRRTSSITSINSNTSYTKDEERKEEKSWNNNLSQSPSKSTNLEEKLTFFSKEIEKELRKSPEPRVIMREKSPKVDIGKRRSMFELNESVVTSSTKEQKQANRRSLDISGTLRNKVASFENLETEAPRSRSVTPNRDSSLRSKVASFENLDCQTSKIRGITPPRDTKFREKLATFTVSESDIQPVQKKNTPERDVNFHKKLASFTSIENGEDDRTREKKTIPTGDPMLKNKIASFKQLEEQIETLKPAPIEASQKSQERPIRSECIDEPQSEEVISDYEQVGGAYEDSPDQPENIYENIMDEPVYENIYEKVNEEAPLDRDLISEPHYQTLEEVREELHANVEEALTPISPEPSAPQSTLPVESTASTSVVSPAVAAPEVLDVTWTDGPSQVAPPSEPPPPPPPDDESDEDVPSHQPQGLPAQEEDTGFTRENSTRRIKKELWRRRSDFLGTSSQYIEEEPAVKPPPDLSEFLRKECEVERALLESQQSKISAKEHLLNEEEINRREREIIENLERSEKLKIQQQSNHMLDNQMHQEDVISEDMSDVDEHLQYQMLSVDKDFCFKDLISSVPPPPPSPVSVPTHFSAHSKAVMPSLSNFISYNCLPEFEESSSCFIRHGGICCSSISVCNPMLSIASSSDVALSSSPNIPEFDEMANCGVRHGGICCSPSPLNMSVLECGVPSLTPIPECEENNPSYSVSPFMMVASDRDFVDNSRLALSPLLEISYSTSPETNNTGSSRISSPSVELTSTYNCKTYPECYASDTTSSTVFVDSRPNMINFSISKSLTESDPVTCNILLSSEDTQNNHYSSSSYDNTTNAPETKICVEKNSNISQSFGISDSCLAFPQQEVQSLRDVPTSALQSLGESVKIPQLSNKDPECAYSHIGESTLKASHSNNDLCVPHSSNDSLTPIYNEHLSEKLIMSEDSKSFSTSELDSEASNEALSYCKNSSIRNVNSLAITQHPANTSCYASPNGAGIVTNYNLNQHSRIKKQQELISKAVVKKSNKYKSVRFNIAHDSTVERCDAENSFEPSDVVALIPALLNPHTCSLLPNNSISAVSNEKAIENDKISAENIDTTSTLSFPSQAAKNQQTSSESNLDPEVAMMVPEASSNIHSSHSVSETTDSEQKDTEYNNSLDSIPSSNTPPSFEPTLDNSEEHGVESFESLLVEAQTVVEVTKKTLLENEFQNSQAETEWKHIPEFSDQNPDHLVTHSSNLDYSSESVASTSSLPDQYKKLAELEEEMMKHDKDMLQRAGKLSSSPQCTVQIPPPSLYAAESESSHNDTSESYSFQSSSAAQHLPIQEFYTAPTYEASPKTTVPADAVGTNTVSDEPNLVPSPSGSPSHYSTLASPHPYNRSHSQPSMGGSSIHASLQSIRTSPISTQREPAPEPLPRKKKLPPPPPNKPQNTSDHLNTAERLEAIRLSRMPTSDNNLMAADQPEHHGTSISPSGQQMSKQTLLALSAIPKPRLTENESWITKKKPDARRDYSKHWLHQEAEQRRLEQQDRINRYKPVATNQSQISTSQHSVLKSSSAQHISPPSQTTNYHPQSTFIPQNTTPTYSSYPQSLKNPSLTQNNNNINSNSNSNNWRNQATTYQPLIPVPTPTGDKALPDSIIHNLTQRVNNKNNKNNYSSNNANGRMGNTFGNSGYRDENYHDYMNADALNTPTGHSPLYQSATGPSQPSPNPQQDAPNAQDQRLLSVSGKKKCSHCAEEL